MNKLLLVGKCVTAFFTFFHLSELFASDASELAGQQLVVSKASVDKLYILICAGMVFINWAAGVCWII